MAKNYKVKKITAEVVNRNRKTWYLTHAKIAADRYARACGGDKVIYQLPNGVYALRKSKNVEGYPKGIFKRKK